MSHDEVVIEQPHEFGCAWRAWRHEETNDDADEASEHYGAGLPCRSMAYLYHLRPQPSVDRPHLVHKSVSTPTTVLIRARLREGARGSAEYVTSTFNPSIDPVQSRVPEFHNGDRKWAMVERRHNLDT